MTIKIHPLAETPVTPDQYRRALIAAKEACAAAYQPYSKYRVGAAVLTAGGDVFKGCNMESANYDGTHAEESALAAMVVAGWRDPILCVCVAGLEGDEPRLGTASCGKCRQILFEFHSLSGQEIWIPIDCSRIQPSMPIGLVKISELLPYSFGPADIGVDLAKYRR
jgi:cytidine deaminase